MVQWGRDLPCNIGREKAIEKRKCDCRSLSLRNLSIIIRAIHSVNFEQGSSWRKLLFYKTLVALCHMFEGDKEKQRPVDFLQS